MGRWVRVGETKDVPVGEGRGYLVEGQDVGVFNVNGSFFAMDNICPHRGAPLADGRVEGGSIVCPWHGWAFDVKNACLAMDPNTKQKKYPVEVRGEVLFVDLESAA
ncbi:MAG: Rieske (2Fe-2S) protein [Elusimicrobia bacterium]|nr:Rieske (2Fe-2S) protein [Elusimicrobiota bacterium]